MFNALTEEFGDFYCDQGIWAKTVGLFFFFPKGKVK